MIPVDIHSSTITRCLIFNKGCLSRCEGDLNQEGLSQSFGLLCFSMEVSCPSTTFTLNKQKNSSSGGAPTIARRWTPPTPAQTHTSLRPAPSYKVTCTEKKRRESQNIGKKKERKNLTTHQTESEDKETPYKKRQKERERERGGGGMGTKTSKAISTTAIGQQDHISQQIYTHVRPNNGHLETVTITTICTASSYA